MSVVRGAEVSEAIPGDVAVTGVRWVQDAKDLVIELGFPGRSQAPRHGELVCSGASNVRVDIDMASYVGTVPAWAHDIVPLGDGRWRVEFDLTPVGAISLLAMSYSTSETDMALANRSLERAGMNAGPDAATFSAGRSTPLR